MQLSISTDGREQRSGMIHKYATDEARWTAVQQRDREADGAFLFGVVTTGVYCRPGCASRTPRRENVRFFTTSADAERAGLRSCKRCVPTADAPDDRAELVRRACAIIDGTETPPTLTDLAEALGVSRFHFQRLFKQVIGVSPKQYALARRRDRLEAQLRGAESVTSALYDAGLTSSSQLYGSEQMSLGMKPTEYRKGGAGQHLRIATARSYLGWVAVAATERGISAIELGDTPEAVEQRVRDRFPAATFAENDADFAEAVAQVVAFLEQPARGLGLPLDIQGTAFQRRVWDALRQVPAGSTVSYTQLANQIGSPTAARAVAGACAANTLAVAIPCHRVVRENGDLSGYRWGIERKRTLLERELQ